MSFKILGRKIPLVKTINYYGAMVDVDSKAVAIATDRNGVVRLYYGEVPIVYGTMWYQKNRDSFSQAVGTFEFEGKWRESLMEIKHDL
jgi:hypothetical protein